MHRPVSIIRGELTGDAALDTATSRAILRRVTDGELGETIQVGTPHEVVAFGKHDALTEGFETAVTIATERGYDPTIRIAGGRAVVFSPTIVRFAWTIPEPEPARTMHERFERLSAAVVAALRRLGVDSVVGELPDEYCAGRYSVHVAGPRKVMGVGQRLTRRAAQVGGVVVVDGAEKINDVLVPVYRALGVPMDPDVTGSVSEIAPVSTDEVMDALAAELVGDRTAIEVTVDAATTSLAAGLRDDHVPQVFA